MYRSLLYVPANSEKFIAKAHERSADAVILDLEDSVPATEKEAARKTLAKSVLEVGRGGAAVFIRVNAPDSAFYEMDIEIASAIGATGLIVPKTQNASMIIALEESLTRLRAPPLKLIPIIEDPGAVLDARAIAKASRQNFALITGGEDLANAMGAQPTPEMLRLPKLLVHMAAKAEQLFSFGLLRSPAGYADTTGIQAAAVEAKVLGFDGATCIHPSIVPILNSAFSPTEIERQRARDVLVAYEKGLSKGMGAIRFEGKMIDLPVAERARRLLSRRE
jgi:citrate lyase subunit beta/citryl-CoA lyase